MKQTDEKQQAMTLGVFQARVHAWAVDKGWADLEMCNPNATPTEVEYKLARIALARRFLDELAERVRIDPKTDISDVPVTNDLLAPDPAADCNKVKVLAKLALISTEITEAVEAVLLRGKTAWTNNDRRNERGQAKPEGLGSELVDINFRCNQLAADLGINLAKDTELKMSYNDGRPYKHGKHA